MSRPASLDNREAAASTDFSESAEADWNTESIPPIAARSKPVLARNYQTPLPMTARRPRPKRRDSSKARGLSPIAGRARRALGRSAAANLEAYVAAEISLKDHLAEQLTLAMADPVAGSSVMR